MKKTVLILSIFIFLSACSRLPGSKAQLAKQTASPDATPGTAVASPLPPTFTPYVTPSPTVELTQGTVTIWHSLSEEQTKALNQILKDFSTAYPDVLFDVLYIPQESLLQRYQIAVQEGNAPDLLFGSADWGPTLYEAGSIIDLSDLVDKQVIESINPAALDGARYQDALVGLPYAQQGVVLYRNKALLNRAPTTFDDLAAQAKSITQGEIIGADLEQGLFYSGGHLQGLGGQLMKPDGTPAFNDDHGRAWLELLKAFEQAGPTEYLSDQDIKLFKEGRVGWIIDGTWNLADLSSALGVDNLAVDPWPSYKGSSLAGYVQPFNIYLSSQSQEDDSHAALKFMSYFLSKESQTQLTDGGLIPVVSGVNALDSRQDILLTEVMTALAGDVPYPTNPELQVYLAPLDAALQSFLTGKATADEALNTAEQLILAQLSQIKATLTPTAIK